MYGTEVTVVGAGVVGLAVAARLASEGRRVLVVERRKSFGQEISSRNSQVIHAGFNYPPGTLKARLCLEGRHLLYQFCEQRGIAYRRLGKLVVATSGDEVPRLEALRSQGEQNGVGDLALLTGHEVAALEPNVRAVAGLLSPSTGVVDAWGLMRALAGQAQQHGATIAYRSEVIGVDRTGAGYGIRVREAQGSFRFYSRMLVNCAGLASDRVAALAGIDAGHEGYRLHYCKAEYFAFTPRQDTRVHRLIYPAPEPEGAGLGIHVTQDVEGSFRLGPSAQYVDELDYSVDAAHQEAFWQAARRFLPALRLEDLRPDFAGIRPKLAGAGEGFRDFMIRHEADRGLPGLVNLVGIESPGLTASLAIARHVSGQLRSL